LDANAAESIIPAMLSGTSENTTMLNRLIATAAVLMSRGARYSPANVTTISEA